MDEDIQEAEIARFLEEKLGVNLIKLPHKPHKVLTPQEQLVKKSNDERRFAFMSGYQIALSIMVQAGMSGKLTGKEARKSLKWVEANRRNIYKSWKRELDMMQMIKGAPSSTQIERY